MRLATVIVLLGIAAISGGCAYSSSGQSYPRYETRTAYEVEYGEVLSTRVVEIEGEASFIGVWGGAEVGRAIGGTVDDGDARRVARAVGGVAGAVAGEAIERKVTEEEGLEITIRLDNRDTIAVVQAMDVPFAPGERVRVLFGPHGSARVSPL
jgi:outer membrane lipoprotein SlyB